MGEKRTIIRLAKNHSGISLWGEHTREEMLEAIREYAENLRLQARDIELADDADFVIEVVRGVHNPKRIKLIQGGG